MDGDIVHGVLDVAGFIPGVGAIADAANGVLYLSEGKYLEAGMSFVSAIPGIGDTVALASKGTKAVKGLKGLSMLGKGKSLLKGVKGLGKKAIKTLKGKAKDGTKALKNWKKTLKDIFKKKKKGDKHVCTGNKCFIGGTLVYTDKGYQPIQKIKDGDLVYSRNEKTGEFHYQKVEQISESRTHTIHKIEINGEIEIETTAYHLFYVEGKGWVNAINLREGDSLLTTDGSASITEVKKERYEEPVIMYNFHVENWSSYFVTEINIYVHNGNGRHPQKGKEFRGGKKKNRNNWYRKNDKDFQKWWERKGKKEWGGDDISDSKMADEVYKDWIDSGKPTVNGGKWE